MTHEEQIIKAQAVKDELNKLLADENLPARERQLVQSLNSAIESLNLFNRCWMNVGSYLGSFNDATKEEWISILALFQATTQRTQSMIVPFLRTECPNLWPELNRILFDGKFTDIPKVELPES